MCKSVRPRLDHALGLRDLICEAKGPLLKVHSSLINRRIEGKICQKEDEIVVKQ